ncbi:cytochrome c biogenesis protein [Roseibium aquae]|uniref:Cytochrome c biogenesis protein n=1 Tax=Roseibium aquae TaxID=1323746 RepID=A0A916WX82_9HYPH|nr:divalent-cation tolerance protein CutA [Roseibium aquae]GGB37638.1 cytochrome c biogenesis protein [Roseibium aquae]
MAIAVCTTTGTREEARAIARACVEARLVACAHLDEIESCFFWDGAMQEEREVRVMLKTIEESYDAVVDMIQKHHSYEEPAIYAFKIDVGSASYLQWILDNSCGA